MRNRRFKWRFTNWTLQGAVLVWAVSSLWGAEADPLFEDKVLARGKGVEVRQSQLDELYVAFKANRAARGQAVTEAQRPKILSDMLERLIDTQIVLARATEEDRKRAEEMANTFVAEQKKQTQSEEAFNRQLYSLGFSPEKYLVQVKEQAIVKAVLDRELRDKQTITEEQIQEVYKQRRELFLEPERVRVRHILFSTRTPSGEEASPEARKEKRKLAEQVLKRAKDGDNFEALVKAYSDEPGVSETAGEYVFARAKDEPGRGFPPEFESAAFSMIPGQISDVVTTVFGYHIIKMVEKAPQAQVPLEKVKNRIRESLLQEGVQKELPGYLDALRKQIGVEILDESLKKG